MAINHRYNFDDVFFRAAAVGLLNVLNNKISVWNRTGDKEYTTIPIPFFYDLTGDERFMQDFYLGDSLDDCIDLKMTEGNIDRIPRGAIRLTNININTSSLTNRFERGEYRKENDDGTLITHNAPLNNIQLDLSFECKITIDGELNALKIVQKMIEVFYRTQTFYFLFGGFTIKAQTGFPESGGLERTFEHSYADDTIRTINFSLEVETYLPVIDESLDFLKSQRIESFYSPIDPDASFGQNTVGAFKDPMYDTIIPNRSIITDKETIPIPSTSNSITNA